MEPSVHAQASGALTTAVLAHPVWRAARAIAAFVGVRGEPDTRPLLEATLEAGRRLWLPRVIDPRGRSALHQVTDLGSQLTPGTFGLLEPTPRADDHRLTTITPSSPIDLVLVPGLAFSSRGARIGFGRGHYDRLLAPLAGHSRPVLMGVCFHAFVDPCEGPIPTEPHDIPMHFVATDRGVHDCRERR